MIVKYLNINGYHGTSEENANSIIKSGFKNSKNDTWYGDGVYFFVEGVSEEPKQQAMEWAIIQSWDNKKKENTYQVASVIESNLEFSESLFLDLTTNIGLQTYQMLKERFKRKLLNSKTRILKKNHYHDHLYLNLAVKNNFFEILKVNTYIKLQVDDRKNAINSRIPNCTICVVYQKENIIKDKKIISKENI